MDTNCHQLHRRPTQSQNFFVIISRVIDFKLDSVENGLTVYIMVSFDFSVNFSQFPSRYLWQHRHHVEIPSRNIHIRTIRTS